MSIFPFIDSTSTSTETNDELPMLKEYAYDFEKNELLLDEGGRTYMVEGNEALRIWIFKALFTGAMSLYRIFLCIWLRNSGSGNRTLHERGDCQTGD